MAARISESEYSRLSDQKADDWRAISNVTPTLVGVAGAIFAAGVARSEAWVVVLAPLPLLLGVFHMVQNARLQLQMITYLETHGPAGQGAWESDIAAVRPQVRAAITSTGPIARLTYPSAWNTWLAITAVTGVLIDMVPALAGFKQWPGAVGVGLVIFALGEGALICQAGRIERERRGWRAAWETHLKGEDDDLQAAVARALKPEKARQP